MLAFNHLGRMGRLGNQMFQFAALKGIARTHGYQVMVPHHTEAVLDPMGNEVRTELFRPFSPRVDRIGVLDVPAERHLREPHFHYSREFVDACPDHASLVGYFQSPRYFEHIADEIRSDFRFAPELLDPCRSQAEKLERPIALHVRRGDFLANPENHHNQPLDYYREALGRFGADRQVVVFSDDIAWCKRQELFRSDRFLASSSGNADIDMCLMSLCDSFIIANSTFSWWPAWLSRNPGKRVIYPARWFGETGYTRDHDTRDLFPEDWVRV